MSSVVGLSMRCVVGTNCGEGGDGRSKLADSGRIGSGEVRSGVGDADDDVGSAVVLVVGGD